MTIPLGLYLDIGERKEVIPTLSQRVDGEQLQHTVTVVSSEKVPTVVSCNELVAKSGSVKQAPVVNNNRQDPTAPVQFFTGYLVACLILFFVTLIVGLYYPDTKTIINNYYYGVNTTDTPLATTTMATAAPNPQTKDFLLARLMPVETKRATTPYPQENVVLPAEMLAESARRAIAPRSEDILRSQRLLQNGQFLLSANGAAGLYMQRDGNLVLYRIRDRFPLWHSSTWVSPAMPGGGSNQFLKMGADCEAVVYSPYFVSNGWSSNTRRQGVECFLKVQNDYGLCLYTEVATPEAIWCAETKLHG